MKKALLAVSFGTTVTEARACITAVEDALCAEAPELDFYRAFTSPTIRRVLAARGETVPSVSEALTALAEQGYDEVYVQPTHVLYGVEYDKIRAEAEKLRPRFEKLVLGKPLLADTDDLRRLADSLMARYPAEPGEALVFMGHGTRHFANAVYPALQTVFHLAGREDILVGTVEGWPTFAELAKQISGSFARARLVPLMLVAGDHAVNDMAGADEDSWKSRLEAMGVTVRCTLQGLGALEAVQKMYRERFAALL